MNLQQRKMNHTKLMLTAIISMILHVSFAYRDDIVLNLQAEQFKSYPDTSKWTLVRNIRNTKGHEVSTKEETENDLLLSEFKWKKGGYKGGNSQGRGYYIHNPYGYGNGGGYYENPPYSDGAYGGKFGSKGLKGFR